MENKKICNIDRGFGEIVVENDNYIVVVWDADPWGYEKISKPLSTKYQVVD